MNTRGDQSGRFVESTIRHLEKYAGGVFSEGILSQTGHGGNTLFYRGYHVVMRDLHSEIVLGVEPPNEVNINLEDVKTGVFGLKGKHKRSYGNIISGYEVKKNDGGINVLLQISEEATTAGRTNNWDKLFYGVYHAGIHPLLRLIEGKETI